MILRGNSKPSRDLVYTCRIPKPRADDEGIAKEVLVECILILRIVKLAQHSEPLTNLITLLQRLNKGRTVHESIGCERPDCQ
jgi:hypothetical protein